MITPEFYNFDILDSTNDTALEMAKEGYAEGTVVLANSQTKGKGRRGRVWLDEAGKCVLMSIILRPDAKAQDIPKLAFMVSLAVVEYLKDKYEIKSQVKWPNDVLVNKKKISGILIETTTCNGKTAVVAGLGINVNQTSFSDEIAGFSTSVALECKKQVSLNMFIKELTEYIIKYYNKFNQGKTREILADWHKHMFGIGSYVEVITADKKIYGKIAGIDAEGALVLKNSDNKEVIIHSADAIKTLQ